MIKIGPNYYRFEIELNPSENVKLDCLMDEIDGREVDTEVIISGSFTICGAKRHEFSKLLGDLIDKYRI